VPAYVGRVGIFRDFNAEFFRLPSNDLAQMLVSDLEKAGAVRRQDGFVVPA
jgi:hypothetical protein